MKNICIAWRLFFAALSFSVMCSGHAHAADASAVSPLDLTAGLRALHRSLDYRDTPAQLFPKAGYNTLLTFEQPLAPSFFVHANVYPYAFSSRGLKANIGLTAWYEVGFATHAVFGESTPHQQKLTSHSSEFFLGARGRLPVGVHELALTAGYGEQRYLLSGDEKSPLVPDVTYQFVRLAAEASFRFEALTAGFHLGTRFVRDTGGLERDWFPSTSTQSVELGFMVGRTIFSGVELVGGFDLVRYAFDFNPIPDNATPTYVAGGGVDEYTSGWLGARISFDRPIVR